MKQILKTTILCASLAICAVPAMADTAKKDEFADLRNSSANMSKEEAKKTEAGAAHIGAAAILAGGYRAYKVYDRVFPTQKLHKQPKQQLSEAYQRSRHQ